MRISDWSSDVCSSDLATATCPATAGAWSASGSCCSARHRGEHRGREAGRRMTPMDIFKTFTIEAAHRLPNVPPGHKCARLHGHSFVVAVHVSGEHGAASGWVMDLCALPAASRPVSHQLAHTHPNT